MTKKEMLEIKIRVELERKDNIDSFYSTIMKDYYNYILIREFSEQEIEKMLSCDNLIENLATACLNDERIMEAQERILNEFLEK